MVRIFSVGAAIVVACLPTATIAADAAAGKAKVQQSCSDCHDPGDAPWKGRSEKAMHDQIAAVMAGKLKHPKKLQLSDADIDNISAYIGSSDH
ncbi:MAG TPA: c-type cytochrome [Steroidobacteraceae bacterium]|nr:c-type cytochrome [Steroidobacteraceae bacterium]